MRITEAAARLDMSPRMLRYREDLGLLPPLRDRPYGRGHAHRQFTEEDLATITAALAIERRFDITPAALAFGLRVLTDPAARAAVADLGRRTGHVPAGPGAGRALDFEKERALRALGGALRGSAERLTSVVGPATATTGNAPGAARAIPGAGREGDTGEGLPMRGGHRGAMSLTKAVCRRCREPVPHPFARYQCRLVHDRGNFTAYRLLNCHYHENVIVIMELPAGTVERRAIGNPTLPLN